MRFSDWVTFKSICVCPFQEKIVEKKPEKPEFIKVIDHCRVTEGLPGTFECTFKGEPAPDIFWYREGYQLQDTSEFQVMVLSGE